MTGGIVVGLGARAGVLEPELVDAVGAALHEAGAGWDDVSILATIDRRAGEASVRAFAATRRWELVAFGAATLGAQDVPHGSARVAAAVGVPGVAEAAALAAAGAGGALILPKRVFGRVVVALARR